MNYLDAGLLLVLGLACWRGYRRGLVVTLGGIGGYAAGILLALTYARTLAETLDARLGITALLAQRAGQWLPSLAQPGENLPPFLQEALALPGIAGLQVDLASRLAGLAWRGMAFLLVAALGVVAVRLLARLITRGLRRGLLGTTNRLGGGLLNLLAAWLLLALAAGLLAPLMVLGGPLARFQAPFYDGLVGPALLETFGLLGAWIYQIL